MAPHNLSLSACSLEVRLNGVAIITLTREKEMNTASPEFYSDLIKCFEYTDSNDFVLVVVLTAAGKVFSAGADLKSGNPFQRPASAKGLSTASLLVSAVYQCRKPIIAAINGSAVGIGITLTLPCDIRIASDTAKIAFPFTQRGIVLEAGSSFFLPRLVGDGKAREWCLTGRTFTAVEERDSGLFNYVLPAAEVLPKAIAIANEIANKSSPAAVTLTKLLLQTSTNPRDSMLHEDVAIEFLAQQEDRAEGIESFVQKRPAKFTSRPSDVETTYPWRRSRL